MLDNTVAAARHYSFTLSQAVRHALRPLLLAALVFVSAGQGFGSVPAVHAPGAPAGSYTLSEFESLNMYNGHINFAIPLALPGGRAGAANTLMLRVDQHYWNTAYVPPDNEAGDHGGPYGRNEEFDGIKGTFGIGGMYGKVHYDERCLGYNVGVYVLMRLYLQTPDGTLYEFRTQANNGKPYHISCTTTGVSAGTNFIAADGSAATFVSDAALVYGQYPDARAMFPSGYVKLADGTHYRVDNGTISWIRDPNGNVSSFTYDRSALANYPPVVGNESYSYGRLTSIKDSLNRLTTICYAGSAACPNNAYDQITYPGVGGTPRTIKIHYDRLNNILRPGLTPVQNLFPEFAYGTGSNVPYNPEKVSAIELPDGRSYRLYYNSYGELARVKLPTGAAYEYDHTPGSGVIGADPFYDKILRRLVKRRVYPQGGTGDTYESETVYEASYDYSTAPPTSVISERHYNSPALGRALVSSTKHYYHGDPRQGFSQGLLQYTPWIEGREYKIEYLDTAAGTPLQSVERVWAQREPVSWWAAPFCHGVSCSPAYAPSNDPRVIETVTRLWDTNQVMKSTSVNPQTGVVAIDQYNNPVDVWDYDFGTGAPGALLRHTHTEYQTAGYDSPAGPHLRRLQRLQQVYDYSAGSARLASQSETRYDEYSLHWNGAVVQWSDPGAARGNPTTFRRWLDPGNTWVEHRVEYDQCGSVRKIWDTRPGRPEQERVTEITYGDNFSDGNNGRNTFAYPTGTKSPVPDSSGQRGSATALTTSTTYDYSTGAVVSSTDVNGKVSHAEYNDPLDRLTAVIRPSAGGRTDYEYGDTVGNLYLRMLSDLDASRRLESRRNYDGLGRAVRSFNFDPQEPSAQWITQDTQYDSLGREKRVSNPYRSAGPGSPVNPSGRWVENTFDSLSRVTHATTTADGAAVVTAYVGSRVTVTDQAGKKRRTVSDGLGRLVRVDEPNAAGDLGPADAPAQPTYYAYDALGLLRRVTQGGQQRFFMYDSLGRLVRAKYPEQAPNGSIALADPVTGNTQWSFAYGYNENGSVVSRTDARGVTATYGYDNLNRNTTVRYSDGTKPVDRFYDGAVNGRGRFYYSNWDPADNTKYETHLAVDEYDDMGRVKKYRQHFLTNGAPSQPFTVTLAYDLAGNVISQTYPSGHVVSYTYDGAGRTSEFSGNLGDGVARTYASGITYSEFGGVQQERFGTHTPLYHKLHYNRRGQLFDIRLSTVAWAADQWNWNRGAIVNYYSTNYAWEGDPNTPAGPDNNGNLRRQQHWVPADDAVSNYAYTQDTFDYDHLNRLSSASEVHGGPWGQSGHDFAQAYDYDRWGNMAVNTAQSHGAPEREFDRGALASSNQLYAPGDLSLGQMAQRQMQYDAAGNLTFDGYTGAGHRAYDAEGRIKSAQQGNGVAAAYAYDADGRRIKRTVNNGTVWQLYGPGGELLAEYNAGAAPFLPVKEFGYRGGQMLVSAASGDHDRLRRFIKNLYYNALSRDPTAAEMQQQTDLLAQAGAQGGQAQFLAAARASSRNLFQSGEYAARGRTDVEYVTDLYNAYLQRGPDTPGLNHWVGTTQQYGRGATLNAFEVCSEFEVLSATVYGTSAQGDNQRAEAFVRNFYYGALRREPTAAEMQQQTARLNNAAALGQSQVVNEARAMGDEIFVATNYHAHRTVQEYVADLYVSFLQRQPDTPGLNHWVGSTQQHGRAATLAAFKLSGEYADLAGTLYREVSWLVPDHLGTPRMVVDRRGTLSGVRRHDYLPFGEEVHAGTGGRVPEQGYAGSGLRQKWAQLERDAETGLDYARARYYSPAAARFTSVDPLASSGRPLDPQSWNRYAYCLNNPLVLVDPYGLEWRQHNSTGAVRWYYENDDRTDTNEYTNEYYETADGQWVHLNPNGPSRNPADSEYNRRGWEVVDASKVPAKYNPANGPKVGPGTSDNSGWLRLTWEYFTGTGPKERQFGPNADMTQGLMTSPDVANHRRNFINQGGGKYGPAAVRFGTPSAEDGPFESGFNMPRQFVGSFYMTITETSNGDALFVIDNTTHLQSLLYNVPGVQPVQRTTMAPLSNKVQTYWWTERGVINR